MSSSALPPLAGVSSGGSRDDRDDQRTPKVKPLPLMLSSRAPLVQAAGGSAGGNRSRPGAGHPHSQPHSHHPPGSDTSGSPGSPGAQQPGAYRSKFTRIRGFQGAAGVGGQSQMLALEGNALQQQQQQGGSGTGRSGTSASVSVWGGGQSEGGQQHHSWDGGAQSPTWGSPPQTSIGTVGRSLAGAGGGSPGAEGVQQGYAGLTQANGSSGSGGGGSGTAWATRRGAGSSTRSISQRTSREVPALEGIGLSVGGGASGGGGSGGGGSGGGGGGASVSRSSNSATFPKYFVPLTGGGTTASRPETAPASPPFDPLSATFPAARGHGLIHAHSHSHVPAPFAVAAINPPLHAALPGAAALPVWVPGHAPAATSVELLPYPTALPPPISLDALGGVPSQLYDGTASAGAYPPDPTVTSSASAPSEGDQPHLQPQQVYRPSLQQLQNQSPSQPLQQQATTAAQLLQRLYRTNRTPPSQSEPFPDLLSPGLRSGSPTPAPIASPALLSQHASGVPSPTFASQTINRSIGGGTASPLSGIASSRPGTTASLSSSLAGGRPRNRVGAAGTLADLSAALQKSIAAGMGEWDLRADGSWGHPEIQQRLLRGPLGPEALKNRYRMEERDIISLYRLLYSYSVGFFTDVESLLDIAVGDRSSGASLVLGLGSPLRQELLENVFRAYASLWDEALLIVFDSEMTSMLADKNAALRAVDQGAEELETLRREKEQLQFRLEDFVKQNIDNMLATRHVQQAASRLEGEVHTLHSANEQLVTNMARHAVQVATIERQLDAARAATEAAEARAVAAEAHLGDLKAIVSEQNATLSAQFFQIKEMERMSGELQDTVRNLNRRRAAVLGLLSGNTPEPSDAGASMGGTPPGTGSPGLHPTGMGTGAGTSGGPRAWQPSQEGMARAGTPDGAASAGGAAAADSATEGVLADVSLLDPDELGRLLSDKTRAFNLMHADFVVKMHELDEQRSANEALRQEVAALQAAVKGSDESAAQSKKTAARWKAKYEGGRMAMEDLEETNRRLIRKNAELVRSYWPLMTRLKDAEAEAAQWREEAARDREAALRDRAEADLLRLAAEDMRAAMQELEELRAEAASHELELPADLLGMLPEGQVAALRRFTRSCHRRVAHLNSQVVALVDQVTASRLEQLQQQNRARAAGGGGAAPAGDAGTAIASGGDGGAAAAAAAAEAAQVEVSELRSAVASRDKWLAVLVKGMSALMGQMENLMARDWETCRTLRLEQQKRKRRAARVAAGLGDFESAPASPERSAMSMALASPERSTTSVVPASPSRLHAATFSCTLPGSVPGSEGVTEGGGMGSEEGGEPQPQLQPEGQTSGGEGSVMALAEDGEASERLHSGVVSAEASMAAAAPGGAATGAEEDEDEDDQDDALTVACGRLAQLLGVGDGADWVERTPQLVTLDRGFERLAESAERLIEWSEGLLKRKEQTSTFTQVRQKLDSVVRQLEAANLELTTLRPTAEALRHSVRGYETKFKEMTATVTSCKHRAETAESRLGSVEAQLSVVTTQLREAQDSQKLLEGEYWKAKDIALDAEVNTGELKAGRMRALEAAAKALASVSGLEKEARENHDQRVALEADLVGYKAWVRHMTLVERKYRATLTDLAQATSGCEERDRKLAELKDRITTLEQQLRFKAIETVSLESRVKALSGELVEERRAARAAVVAARTSTAAQLDAAIRQAGDAEADAAAQTERANALEGRLSDATSALEEARAAADAAEARLVPLTSERNRLRSHVAASQPLLLAMDRAATAIGQRLTLLEEVVQDTTQQQPADDESAERTGTGTGFGSRSGTGTGTGTGTGAGSGSGTGRAGGVPGVRGGSLDSALTGLLDAVEGALDACEAVAAEAAGDATPALLGALEGLLGQLLSTVSKGGVEPIQSLAVLKAQLARDDKELVALRAAMVDVRVAGEEAARSAALQRAAAQAATAAAQAASAAAARDGRRAAEAEAALQLARGELEARGQELSEARQAAEALRRQLERLQKRSSELESDVAAARSQRRHQETQAAAAAQQCGELKRRAEELETQGLRDQDAAREARERADMAEAAVAASAGRCSELEAAVESEQREAARLRAEAETTLAAAAEARAKAVDLEQQMLEMQAKYADMIRHDEAMEERLRQARFEAEAMRKRAADATAEAAEVNAQYEALQQRAWQLQVAIQAKHGEREEALRELVEVTHGAAARKGAAVAVGAASVKQRTDGTQEVAGSFKASRKERAE